MLKVIWTLMTGMGFNHTGPKNAFLYPEHPEGALEEDELVVRVCVLSLGDAQRPGEDGTLGKDTGRSQLSHSSGLTFSPIIPRQVLVWALTKSEE